MPWLCTAAGQPDRIMNAPSAFREGDSATRSRVEKLPETTNQPKKKMRIWREQGRHHPPPVPRLVATKIWSCTYPHPRLPTLHPWNLARTRKDCSSAAAVPWSRAAGTRVAVGGGGSAGKPGSLPLAPLSTLPPPLTRDLGSRSGVGI